MKKIVVACDTACDLPQEYKDKYDIKFINVPCILNGNEHFNLDNQAIFDYVKRTGDLPKTAAPSFENFKIFLTELADKNDYVIYFCMSKGISASYSICCKLEQEIPNLKIIDSKNLSGGIALQVVECLNDIEKNSELNDIIKNAQNRVGKVASGFVIDTLTYLHKGGRCSTIALLGANLLKIKPQIVVNDGVMMLAKKFKGKLETVIADYMKAEFDNNDNIDKENIIIAYTTYHKEIFQSIKEKLKQIGFKKIYFVVASSTIACHCGPNTFGFFYWKRI